MTEEIKQSQEAELAQETSEVQEEQSELNEEQTAEKSEAEQILELAAQVAALKEQYLRERAENENLRKRQERELANAHKFAVERLIRDLFPVLDSLSLGLAAAQEAAAKDEANQEAIAKFVEGLEMTAKILTENLARNGVTEITAEKGEKFNPENHEAIAMFPNPECENNTIFELSQKGYALNGRVVRAAKVVVVKNS
ncbi:MAG: nucleotide exchange factor GrpE [Cardiobacteriaceae bacterium]|nr:nucleotide exchange factor GrpE [Cardiobacteriaceae bacterium]